MNRHITFSAGTAIRSIHPDASDIDNSIHGLMTVRLDEPGSPLQVKALACERGSTRTLLLVFDIVGIEAQHVAPLRSAVAGATGLPVDSIILHSSHSHSTPFLESLSGAHPYFDKVKKQAVEAAVEAWQTRRPAKTGHAVTTADGFSYNTRVPMPDGGVKFSRDYHEGLASGRPVDPRLNVLRIDDAETGQPIAGWVRVAAHPACVVFDAPVSAEFPGYLTDQLSRTVAGGAPVLFGLGACGDVNCIPMFGQESDSRALGLRLAEVAAPLFENIETKAPQRFLAKSCVLELPLADVPSIETLDREIAEVEAFIARVDEEPTLEWAMGINIGRDFPVEMKKAHFTPLAEWARMAKGRILAGEAFPHLREHPVSVWIIDDLGLAFDCSEPLVEIGLDLAEKSPLSETLLTPHSNGADAYLCMDHDVRRGGFEGYTHIRHVYKEPTRRILPHALGAADQLIAGFLEMIEELLSSSPERA